MTTMHHTLNFAAVPVVTVFDDRGQVIEILSLPICLLITLPCHLYAAWLGLARQLPTIRYLLSAILTFPLAFLPGGWREDLNLILASASALASALAFPQKRSYAL